MEAVTLIAGLCFFFGLPTFALLVTIFVIKPEWLNVALKSPWSRKRIAGVGFGALVVSTFFLIGVMATTMPTSFKQSAEAQRAKEEESRARQAAELQRKNAEAKAPKESIEEKIEVIPFTSSEQNDTNLPKGERKISVEGKNGERKIKYKIITKEGKEIQRTEISNEVTVQPVNQVTLVGTYVPKPTYFVKPQPSAPSPAPTPQPTAAYYPNCSAARAAGVTPIYRGQPGYGSHLDRDNDGIACE